MTYQKMKPSRANQKKFDLDLANAEKYEHSLANIITGDKVEIKTEVDQWKKTGNVVVEFESRGKPSGLVTTEADWWCFIFSFEDNIEKILIVPVERLKILLKQLKEKGKARIIRGGDDRTSKLVILKIKDLI